MRWSERRGSLLRLRIALGSTSSFTVSMVGWSPCPSLMILTSATALCQARQGLVCLGQGWREAKQHTQLAGPIVVGAAVLADVRHDLFPQVAWT